MNTNFSTIRVSNLVLVVAILFSTGCTSPKMFSLDESWPFKDKDAPQEGTPARMVGTWADTVLTQPGQKPQRGFGGRILFYDHEGKKPILVDGQLVVYAFDETGRDPTNNKPTRRYVFPAEQLPAHMSKGELGASYSFWLPWDDAGGPRTEICLISRFEPKGGAVVTSEQTRHLLPGTAPAAGATAGAIKPPKVPEGVPSKPSKESLESVQNDRNERRAQLTSYEAPVTADSQAVASTPALQAAAMPEKRMTSTTITLPKNYQLPDTAALNSAAVAAGYSPMPQQVPQQFVPQGTPSQIPVGTMQTQVATMPAVPAQQGFMRTYANQPMQQQLPANTPAQMNMGVQPAMGTQPALNIGPLQQSPQQFQQPLIQALQHQQAMRQVQPPVQTWPQLPNQPVQSTAVNYPVQAQYPR
jgi:hypothetical protein